MQQHHENRLSRKHKKNRLTRVSLLPTPAHVIYSGRYGNRKECILVRYRNSPHSLSGCFVNVFPRTTYGVFSNKSARFHHIHQIPPKNSTAIAQHKKTALVARNFPPRGLLLFVFYRFQFSTSGDSNDFEGCSPLSSGNIVPAGITGRISGLINAFAVSEETTARRYGYTISVVEIAST